MSARLPKSEVEGLLRTNTRFLFGVPVGVDVGRRNLLTLAPATAGPEVDDALALGNRGIEGHYSELRERYERGRGVDETLADQLDAVLTATAHEALSYVETFDAPVVLVLEDIGYTERSLAECVREQLGVDCWSLPSIQQRLVEVATEANVPVATTTERYTTKECHICGMHSKVRDETIRCTNDSCPVGSVNRDRSAAVSIAKRGGDVE